MERSGTTEEAFFFFLRKGLWGEEEAEPAGGFTLTGAQWEALFGKACSQAVAGIWIDGVAHTSVRPPEAVWGKWVAFLLFQKRMNLDIGRKAFAWTERLEKAGVRTFVFKGVSVARWYRRPLYRGSGDLDLVVTEGWERLGGVLSGWGMSWAEAHQDIQTEDGDLLVEFHQDVEFLYNPFMQSRLRRMQAECAGDKEFYWVCLILHLRRHCLIYGVGLKQVCDVAVMWAHAGLDAEKAAWMLRRLHAVRFSRALFAFMERHLGLSGFPLPPQYGRRQRTLEQIILKDAYRLKPEREKKEGRKRAYARVFSNMLFWTRRSAALWNLMPGEACCFPVYLAVRRIRHIFWKS